MIKQPGLFDEPEPEKAPAIRPPAQPSGWREVHQATFLSWTPEQQLRYCANRDFDSAVEAEEFGNEALAEWFQERGTAYLTDVARMKV